MDREIQQQFNRINEKLNKLMEKQRREAWVSVDFIQMLTGWDAEQLRAAREQGIVKCKPEKKRSWLYLLESIPEAFIIRNKEKVA